MNLSDDDLWDILGVSPQQLNQTPPCEWMEWARNELVTHDGDYLSDYLFLPRLIRIAYFIMAASGPDILTWGKLHCIYQNAWAACKVSPSEYSFRKMIRYGTEYHHRLCEHKVPNEPTRITFTFKGRQEWLVGGQPPTSFMDIPYGLPSIPSLLQTPNSLPQEQSQHQVSVLDSNNSATAIAAGGKGGDARATLITEKDAYHPETTVAPVIAPTFNNTLPNPADTVVAGADQYERGLQKGIEIASTRFRAAPPRSAEEPHQDDSSDYDGPEPSTNSPEKKLDPKTMITRPEIVTLLTESKHTWNWISPTLEKMKIEPCFIPRQRDNPNAYWRAEIGKAIAAKRETE